MALPAKKRPPPPPIEQEDELSSKRQKVESSDDEDNGDEDDLQQQIRLEEEILLLEQSMASLTQRKQSIDQQLQDSIERRDEIRQVLTTQNERKQQLQASQVKHQKLLQELQKSLSKSHDILVRLNAEGGMLDEEEIAQLTEEIQQQEEKTSFQQKEQELEAEEAVIIETNVAPRMLATGASIKLWLFLDFRNLDWFLATSCNELELCDCELERVFLLGKENANNPKLDLLLENKPNVHVHRWPLQEELPLQSESSTVLALTNIPIDPEFFVQSNLRFVVSTKDPGTKNNVTKLEVSHPSVGGVTSTRHFLSIIQSDDDGTIDFAKQFANYLASNSNATTSPRANNIESIRDLDYAGSSFPIPAPLSITVHPLRSLTLNGLQQPPIYHSGGLLPPTPLAPNTLIGYSQEISDDDLWTARSLTRTERLRAYDIDDKEEEEEEDSMMDRIGNDFVPLRILRATLQVVTQIIRDHVTLPIYRCPIVPLDKDNQRLQEFWQAHSDVYNPHCWMSLTPCIGDANTITKIMNVNALEALMTDAACGDNVQAAGIARRQTIWNSCLDFVLMVGNSTNPVWQTNDKTTTDGEAPTVVAGTEEKVDDETDPPSEKSQPIHLDPNIALCPYELGGVCADPFCPYQHLTEATKRPRVVPRELLPLPPLKLPENPSRLEELKESTKSTVEVPAANAVPTTNEKTAAGVGANGEQGDSRAEDDKGAAQSAGGDSQTETQGEAQTGYRIDEAGNDRAIVVDSDGDNDGFESNLDFISFDITRSDSGDEIDEDMLTLETAGLVGLGEDPPTEEHVPSNDYWWQSATGELPAGSPIEDWLQQFGFFHVMPNDAVGQKEKQAFLEYRGTKPTNALTLCVFATKVVDCSRMLVHAGRFDLTRPVCTTSLGIALDLTGKLGKAGGLLREILTLNSEVLDLAHASQHGFRSTFHFQAVLASASEILLAAHSDLSRNMGEHEIKWEESIAAIQNLSKMVGGPGRKESGTGDKHTQTAWYIRESIKFDLLGRSRSDSSGVDTVGASTSTIQSLVETTQKACEFAALVRSRFSLLSVSDDVLRPIWFLVKSSLHQRRNEKSTVGSCIYLGYILFGALEGAVDYLKGLECDLQQLKALDFSSMAQLDGVVFGMVKSLNHIVATKENKPLLAALVAPVITASVSFASQLGLYIKAQHRLEEALSSSAGAKLLPYSEILWSQLVQLISALPVSQQLSTKRPWWLPEAIVERHKKVAMQIASFGVFLHHVALCGDWSLLCLANRREKQLAMQGAEMAASVRQQFWLLLRKGASVGFQTGSYLRVPASVRRIEGQSRDHEFTMEFPRSLLVYGADLRYLNVVGFLFRGLPQSFGRYFQELKTLDISHNKIDQLPDSIGQLKNLEMFCANRNRLRVLPDSLGKLKKLRKLLLCDNCLDSFPPFLLKLKMLEELQLRGNNFDMTDSAQLTLELPKLRVFVPPGSEVGSNTNTELPRINHQLAEPLREFWDSRSREDRDKPLEDILKNASSSTGSCLKKLGLPGNHCGFFFIKGTCIERDCPDQHGAEDVDSDAAAAVARILKKGYEVEDAWTETGMGSETLINIAVPSSEQAKL